MGRPNVGKSTLFNALTRSRQALVQNQAGVTRDFISGQAHWWGHEFEVFDSAGVQMGHKAASGLAALAQKQFLNWAHRFDFFILVTDGRESLCAEDKEWALWLNKQAYKFCVVVNKVDRAENVDVVMGEFFQLHSKPIASAFESGFGVDQLVEKIIVQKSKTPSPTLLKEATPHGLQPPSINRVPSSSHFKIALIGQPNAGKSQLYNYLLGESRALVSPQPGSTLDCVEEPFEWQGHKFSLIDTAGLRARRRSRKKQAVALVQENEASEGGRALPNRGHLELLSNFKVYRRIEQADLVLLIVDAVKGVCDQSLKLAELIQKQKPFVLLMNKCDCLSREQKALCEDELRRRFHFVPHLLPIFISARTGQGVGRVLKTVLRLKNQMHKKIPTAQLNKFLVQSQTRAPMPRSGNRFLKCYYMTQTRQVPPSFLLFVNEPRAVTPQYKKFLTKRMQKQWGLQHVPLNLHVLPK